MTLFGGQSFVHAVIQSWYMRDSCPIAPPTWHALTFHRYLLEVAARARSGNVQGRVVTEVGARRLTVFQSPREQENARQRLRTRAVSFASLGYAHTASGLALLCWAETERDASLVPIHFSKPAAASAPQPHPDTVQRGQNRDHYAEWYIEEDVLSSRHAPSSLRDFARSLFPFSRRRA